MADPLGGAVLKKRGRDAPQFPEDELEDDANDHLSLMDTMVDDEPVQVNFDLVDLTDKHYHSVKQFLLNYLDGTVYVVSDLADLVVKNKQVGTSVRVNEEEDSYGFVSVINMHHHTSLKPIQEIRNFLLRKCKKNQELSSTLIKLFSDPSQGLGLLINERMINIPDALAPPLHRNLFDEIAYAYKNEAETVGKLKYWDLEHYMMLTTVYTEANASRLHAGKRSRATVSPGSDYKFQKGEDVVYLKYAAITADWVVRKVAHTMDGVALTEIRMLMIIERSKIPLILKELEQLYPAPTSATVLPDGMST